MTRRHLLQRAALGSLACLGDARVGAMAQTTKRLNIGACDWSLGMRGRTEAFAVAKKLGLDGVQVSMGGVDNDLQLRRRRGLGRVTTVSSGEWGSSF